jgi:rRNA maturation endonuclease Nob1
MSWICTKCGEWFDLYHNVADEILFCPCCGGPVIIAEDLSTDDEEEKENG